MIRRGEPEHDRSGDEGAIASTVGPGDQKPQQDRHQREVEGVGLGVRADLPDDPGQGQPDARHHAEERGPGQRPHQVDRHGRCDRDGQTSEQVHAEGRLAERAQQHIRHPAKDHVRGEARRVGDAHHRGDGLELGRVPEPEPGHHREACGDERDESDEDRWQPRHGGPGHHPRMRPHMTPQALTAIETTTSPITRGIAQTRRRARSTSHEDPIAMRTSANGTTSLLNR